MDKPTASPARWPYTEHRSMAQVLADEALAAGPRLCRKCNQYRRVRCGYSNCPAGQLEAA